MAETLTPAIQIPNYHLNRRLLRRISGTSEPLTNLLELLCTDSVYPLRDDFDDGLSTNRWISQRLEWQPNDMQGSVASFSWADENDDQLSSIYLASRTPGWRPGRRCTVQMGFILASVVTGKFEFGFEDLSPSEVGEVGIVTEKDTPLSHGKALNFGLAVLDSNDNSALGIVRRGGLAASVAATDPTVPVPLTGNKSNTILLSLNEVGEVAVWVNGVASGRVGNGPTKQSNLHIWTHVSGAPNLTVDYIQAWQERVTL